MGSWDFLSTRKMPIVLSKWRAGIGQSRVSLSSAPGAKTTSSRLTAAREHVGSLNVRSFGAP
jgi:hypothetical protein